MWLQVWMLNLLPLLPTWRPCCTDIGLNNHRTPSNDKTHYPNFLYAFLLYATQFHLFIFRQSLHKATAARQPASPSFIHMHAHVPFRLTHFPFAINKWICLLNVIYFQVIMFIFSSKKIESTVKWGITRRLRLIIRKRLRRNIHRYIHMDIDPSSESVSILMSCEI